MNMLWRGRLQFPMPVTRSRKSPACQYRTPPSLWLFGKHKMPSLSSPGLYGTHLALIAKPLMHECVGGWPVAFLIHWRAQPASLLILSGGSLDPQRSGSGFGSVCAVSLSDSYDPLPLNEGEQSWEMRHFRAQGFIPKAPWITLQHTKRRRDSIFYEILHSEHCSRPS